MTHRAMDVDEVNMDFPNAYVDTEVDHINVGIQPQGLADQEAEVKVVYRATRRRITILCRRAQRGVRDKRNILSQNVKRCRRLVTTAISSFQLCIIQDQ
jgi:L-2-hydroxyglutarate oxidase LhgO